MKNKKLFLYGAIAVVLIAAAIFFAVYATDGKSYNYAKKAAKYTTVEYTVAGLPEAPQAVSAEKAAYKVAELLFDTVKAQADNGGLADTYDVVELYYFTADGSARALSTPVSVQIGADSDLSRALGEQLKEKKKSIVLTAGLIGASDMVVVSAKATGAEAATVTLGEVSDYAWLDTNTALIGVEKTDAEGYDSVKVLMAIRPTATGYDYVDGTDTAFFTVTVKNSSGESLTYYVRRAEGTNTIVKSAGTATELDEAVITAILAKAHIRTDASWTLGYLPVSDPAAALNDGKSLYTYLAAAKYEKVEDTSALTADTTYYVATSETDAARVSYTGTNLTAYLQADLTDVYAKTAEGAKGERVEMENVQTAESYFVRNGDGEVEYTGAIIRMIDAIQNTGDKFIYTRKEAGYYESDVTAATIDGGTTYYLPAETEIKATVDAVTPASAPDSGYFAADPIRDYAAADEKTYTVIPVAVHHLDTEDYAKVIAIDAVATSKYGKLLKSLEAARDSFPFDEAKALETKFGEDQMDDFAAKLLATVIDAEDTEAKTAYDEAKKALDDALTEDEETAKKLTKYITDYTAFAKALIAYDGYAAAATRMSGIISDAAEEYASYLEAAKAYFAEQDASAVEEMKSVYTTAYDILKAKAEGKEEILTAFDTALRAQVRHEVAMGILDTDESMMGVPMAKLMDSAASKDDDFYDFAASFELRAAAYLAANKEAHEEYEKSVGEKLWQTMFESAEVTLPARAVRMAEGDITDHYKQHYYETATNYTTYKNFRDYLVAELKVSDYKAAKAAIREQAERNVKQLLIIYTLADELDVDMSIDAIDKFASSQGLYNYNGSYVNILALYGYSSGGTYSQAQVKNAYVMDAVNAKINEKLGVSDALIID